MTETAIQSVADALRAKAGSISPEIAIVLGLGLGGLAARVESPVAVPYEEIEGHPRSTVAGHAGEWIIGALDGTPVLLQSGRFHLYEGHEPSTVVLPVRVMAELGVRTLILTNAAGCLRPAWRPPSLMLVADHLNFSFEAPLRGPVVGEETRFPDMSDPYDSELRQVARDIALESRIQLHEGTYAAMMGPTYETPAEIRMLDRYGADAVGMSTVPEAIAAAARGIRTLAISSLTNLAAGISKTKLDHAEVLEAGDAVRESLETLVRGIVRRVSMR